MRKFVTLLIGFALLVAACGGGDDSADTTSTTATSDDAQVETTEATSTETPATTSPPETTAAPETTTTSDPAATGDSPLLAALAQSEQATSGRMEGSFVISGAEGMPAGTEFTINFSGEYAANGDNTFIMDLSEAAGAAPGGEEIPAEFADAFGEMEIRTVGDTSYLRFGMFSLLGVETEWVSMAAEDAGSTASSFGANPVNPADIMSTFGPGVSDPQDLGRETVRGVETTHYAVLVDVEKIMTEADPEALEELEGIGTGFPTGELPVNFWIGDDGNIYRFSMEFDGATTPDSGFEAMTMIWEMFDYGAAIEIVAPPADQVTDGSNLAGMFTTPDF
jgi:hypothetical protein